MARIGLKAAGEKEISGRIFVLIGGLFLLCLIPSAPPTQRSSLEDSFRSISEIRFYYSIGLPIRIVLKAGGRGRRQEGC